MIKIRGTIINMIFLFVLCANLKELAVDRTPPVVPPKPFNKSENPIRVSEHSIYNRVII